MTTSYTPLRYPGGKSKLYDYMCTFINQYYEHPPVYAEAFAGGFGLGMKLLLQDKVNEVYINDFDVCIYSFWKSITSPNCYHKFVELVRKTPVDIDNYLEQRKIYRNPEEYSTTEVGFATFFLNRCNRSGILSANPIGGIEQTGNYKMDCRFNKPILLKLIEIIYNHRHQIHVANLDAIEFINQIDNEETNILFNLDPPYVSAGPTLYKNNFSDNDHIALANHIHHLNNHWIMTYDNHDLIRKCYQDYLIREYSIKYSLEEKRNEVELIIYDNAFIDPPHL